jgi:hypothetical protein
MPGKQTIAIQSMATGNASWFILPFTSKDEARAYAAEQQLGSVALAKLHRIGAYAIKMKGG